MNVTVKLFATLRKGRFEIKDFDIADGTTVREVMDVLDIPEGQATLIFVNGRHAEFDRVLNDGEVLALFPPIGGG